MALSQARGDHLVAARLQRRRGAPASCATARGRRHTRSMPAMRKPAGPRPSRSASACSSTTRLSSDGTLSCASCHHAGAGLHRRPRARLGRQLLDRNTPSLWNAVHERWYGWDGAADSLWSQAIRPILDAREMAASAAHVRAAIARRQRAGLPLRAGVRQPPGGDDEAVLVDAAKAIGAFVGTLQSGRTAVRRFSRRAGARRPRAPRRAIRSRRSAARASSSAAGAASCATWGRCSATASSATPACRSSCGRASSTRAATAASRRCARVAYNLLSRWSDAPDPSASVKTRHVQAQHRNFGEFKVPSLRNVALHRALHARRPARDARTTWSGTTRSSTSIGCTPTANASSSRCI